ncbi:MAG: hypothetical protein IJU38_02155, partial [Clostridia bacterium]|nr:hypothetical protein [Clostridia bacterium]
MGAKTEIISGVKAFRTSKSTGFIGIEAVNGVQIAGKAADLVDVQELVFQREGIELGFELFDGDILFLALIVIPGIQRDSEVID